MILENMNDMVWYVEKKFSSDAYEAIVKPTEDFKDVVKLEVTFLPKKPGLPIDTAFIWCNTKAHTAGAPLK